MDNFKEQLVRANSGTAYKTTKVFTYIFGALAVLFLGTFQLILAAIFGLAAVGLFLLKRRLYLEYEYSITNGEVDVDKIIEAKSRKKLITFNMKEVELLAPLDSSEYKSFSGKPEKIINAVPNGDTNRKYGAIINGGGKRAQLIFVPNKEFVDLCFIYNPKAVKKFI
ncbi:DUF6106 family protein [Alloiococcus sp. CFN-8]|uniref:DUF6106 family protein n=1 Tax=Alloiococcus sp. CFN-8 TaxID=3416081 RepID=UPI003CEDD915